MNLDDVYINNVQFGTIGRCECVRGGDIPLKLGSAVISELQHHRSSGQQVGQLDLPVLLEGGELEARGGVIEQAG